MIFSIPIDIKRCILEGIEPPDDAKIWATLGELRARIVRNVPLASLSAQSRVLTTSSGEWLGTDEIGYAYFLSTLPKFPLLMPDDDFAAAINKYAAEREAL